MTEAHEQHGVLDNEKNDGDGDGSCCTKAKNKKKPMDVSRALAYFDHTLAEDRMFVVELMTASDYLAC